MIEEGTTAPDFTLPDQDGADVSLGDRVRGQTVVLYFYPNADTPGCTTQACGIRDCADEYEAAGAVVIGVSPDPVDAIKKFHGGQSLNFTLLADEEYGKKRWGVQRATYIIDGDGKVAKVFPKVSPKTQDDLVLEALAA